jgi:glucans biosynthesis protein
MQRRRLLHAIAATAAAAAAGPAGSAEARGSQSDRPDLKSIGRSAPFDYAWLKGHARELSGQPYQPHEGEIPAAISNLSWDQYQAIQFRKEHALWHGDGLRFEAKFFHLGLYFKSPVRLYEVVDGTATEIAYDDALFDYGNSGVRGRKLPEDLGFAGFRLNFHTDLTRDIVAFLGASYFRAVGGDWQYGLSARGLAIDSGLPRPEEFPNFVAYWLERPAPGSSTIAVHALLDSPSTTGAYRFLITPGATLVMDVDAALYPRKPIERLGIAPLTSMFQYGENDRRLGYDWRPEIHDSDGLQLLTGSGEWIWRPLLNPRYLRFNAYADDNPGGFGLLQRDRNFDHYQDDGVFYDRRPSVWVQPKAGWGRGSVQLIEIPTVDETFDNIVAFWNPAKPPQPGQELLFGYRLYWGSQMPARPPSAIVLATRTGLGGVVGQKRKYYAFRFVIDFAGGDLSLLGPDAKVQPKIDVSRGRIELVSARPLASVNGWRAMFDLVPDESEAPIDMRLYLDSDGQALSETWQYQWNPPPMAERALY